MADVVQTPANVRLKSANSNERKVRFGETIQPGDWLYHKASDDEYYKAEADGATAAEAEVKGMALTYGGDGTYGFIAPNGATVNVGAVLTQAATFVLSATAGKMAPYADLIATQRVTHLGVGQINGDLVIDISASGVPKP